MTPAFLYVNVNYTAHEVCNPKCFKPHSEEYTTLKKQILSPISKHQSHTLCNLITGLLMKEGIKFPLKPSLVDNMSKLSNFTAFDAGIKRTTISQNWGWAGEEEMVHHMWFCHLILIGQYGQVLLNLGRQEMEKGLF